jgi:hypothetical protein
MSKAIVAKKLSSILSAYHNKTAVIGLKDNRKDWDFLAKDSKDGKRTTGSKTWNTLTFNGNDIALEVNDVKSSIGLMVKTENNKVSASTSISWNDNQVKEWTDFERMVCELLYVKHNDLAKKMNQDSAESLFKNRFASIVGEKLPVKDAKTLLPRPDEFYPQSSWVELPMKTEEGHPVPGFGLEASDGSPVVHWAKCQRTKLPISRVHFTYEITIPANNKGMFKTRMVCHRMTLKDFGNVTTVSESDELSVTAPSPSVASASLPSSAAGPETITTVADVNEKKRKPDETGDIKVTTPDEKKNKPK